METWFDNHPNELPGLIVENRNQDHPDGCLEIPYPNGRQRADVAFSTDTSTYQNDTEWLLEVKKVEFVGDVGAKSSHQETGVATLLSPFHITRGVMHDIDRIRENLVGRRKAVLIYSFHFDQDVLQQAETHPERATPVRQGATCDRFTNLTGLLEQNNDHPLALPPLLESFETLCAATGRTIGQRVHREFFGLTRHPIFIRGDVVAWEVL
jgi:hypothetical protein